MTEEEIRTLLLSDPDVESVEMDRVIQVTTTLKPFPSSEAINRVYALELKILQSTKLPVSFSLRGKEMPF